MKHGGVLPGIFFHFPADEVAQGKNHGIGYFIADRNAPAFTFDQMTIMQGGQMFGNVGLFHGSCLHQFADGERSVVEDLQQNQPAGFGKHGKQAGNRLKLAG